MCGRLWNFLLGVVNISQHSSGGELSEWRRQAMQGRLRFPGEGTLPVEPHSKRAALLDEDQMSPRQDGSRRAPGQASRLAACRSLDSRI